MAKTMGHETETEVIQGRIGVVISDAELSR